MAIQKINSSDKIQSGFRAKYNAAVDEIWTSVADQGDGTLKITKFSGATLIVSLASSFYTKTELQNLITGISQATTETAGVLRIATEQEAIAGTSLITAITPATLRAVLDTLSAAVILLGKWINNTTFQDLDDIPYTPEELKLYWDVFSNQFYAWNGSAYAITNQGLQLGETSSSAYRGDRGKDAYDHSQVTGNPHNTAIEDIFGLQSQLDEKAKLSDVLNLSNAIPPANATDPGVKGEVRISTTYIYVCVATNTWARSPLSTW
ncbi:hypothetical protein BWD42_04015 [Sphingobacterium sp. CZ-UAM]|uniref:hypothetical protein n=1 Tax=Sphingobacterium sp. CZ-UAM TaxID=1933868 RepID=UPI00098637B2|nr:hypothetical protein [Sphingobacterium sp. CZ-UAM]OOG19123.1 hypothetical protein BWD42_04015 [Sphingobacterium sp. CZ-UAM]